MYPTCSSTRPCRKATTSFYTTVALSVPASSWIAASGEPGTSRSPHTGFRGNGGPTNRPSLPGWFDPPTREDIYEVSGILPSLGSAYTGIGESFTEFYWLTPLFWFVIGWCFGWLYRFAMLRPMSVWSIVYIGLIAATHYLVTQGFAAFFVPACIYVVLPVIIFTIAGSSRRRSSKASRCALETSDSSLRPRVIEQLRNTE